MKPAIKAKASAFLLIVGVLYGSACSRGGDETPAARVKKNHSELEEEIKSVIPTDSAEDSTMELIPDTTSGPGSPTDAKTDSSQD